MARLDKRDNKVLALLTKPNIPRSTLQEGSKELLRRLNIGVDL
jgi:hypothetical protein